jgi:hypothetical protein
LEDLVPIYRHRRRRVQIRINSRMPEHGHATGPQKPLFQEWNAGRSAPASPGSSAISLHPESWQ